MPEKAGNNSIHSNQWMLSKINSAIKSILSRGWLLVEMSLTQRLQLKCSWNMYIQETNPERVQTLPGILCPVFTGKNNRWQVGCSEDSSLPTWPTNKMLVWSSGVTSCRADFKQHCLLLFRKQYTRGLGFIINGSTNLQCSLEIHRRIHNAWL